MKRNITYLILLSFLSFVSGYLLSKLSMTGKFGINLLYKQYKFLKNPLKGSTLILSLYLILFLLLYFVYKRWTNNNPNKISILILLLGIIGALLTYYDFVHTLAHKILGQSFHFGAYVFWLGWISIPVYYLANRKKAYL